MGLLDVLVLDQNGNTLAQLACVQGSTVTDDRTQATRHSCSLTVPDPLGILAPTSNGSALQVGSVSSNVVKVTAQRNAMGTFIVQTSDLTDSGAGRTIAITGQDRSWLVTRPPLATAWTVGVGEEWSDAIAQLILHRQPQANLTNVQRVPWPTPAIVLNPGEEPWTDLATEWAPAIGYELWWDQNDVGNLAVPPDPRLQVPDYVLTEGVDCTMTQVEPQWTDDSVPNAWQYDGVGPSNVVVTGTAEDENPASPTYVRGGYGLYLDYEQDTLIYSQPQADAAARLQLYLGLGANEPVELTLIPSAQAAGMVAGQMALVTRKAAGLSSARVVFDTIQHGFFPGDLTTVTGRVVTPWAT